ncbi:MAG: Mrp/NBP35 family ATP-binding protein [Muribaculaceae bacterium]|nr:Mrp/NBP35 family ATP-binding protein [Muribaculaceae bacterium]
MIYPKLITEKLESVRYPGNGKSLTENGMVEDIHIDGNHVSLSILFDKEGDPFAASTVRSAEATLRRELGPEVEVSVSPKYNVEKTKEPKEKPLKNVKYKIGISSGKGGVGKSTVAANLAVALASQGFKVGLLDADIFGPSVPKMFGVEDEGLYMVNQEGRDWIEPVEKYGVKMLSIGFVVDKRKAVVWRGTMASNALRQLITDAWWGDLDFFLIDLPPGTSDIHLTLVQTLDLDGAIIVTTPQEVALADARKGVEMFQNDKINVPVLGIVENMAWFTPLTHPEEKYYIFGNGGGVRLADELHVPLLAQIPLVAEICEKADAGAPVSLALAAMPADNVTMNPVARAFHDLSVQLLSRV